MTSQVVVRTLLLAILKAAPENLRENLLRRSVGRAVQSLCGRGGRGGRGKEPLLILPVFPDSFGSSHPLSFLAFIAPVLFLEGVFFVSLLGVFLCLERSDVVRDGEDGVSDGVSA